MGVARYPPRDSRVYSLPLLQNDDTPLRRAATGIVEMPGDEGSDFNR